MMKKVVKKINEKNPNTHKKNSKTPIVLLSVVCHKAVKLILLAFFFHCTLCISPALNKNLSWWGSLLKGVAQTLIPQKFEPTVVLPFLVSVVFH